MTKTPPITSTEELARAVLEELRETLLSFETAARQGDVDAIHEMRVTVRRLRVAVANFRSCLAGENRSLLGDRLTELAEHLGAVRDFDVLMDELTEALSQCPVSDRRYLRAMIKRLRDRRRRRLQRLIRLLDSSPLSSLPIPVDKAPDVQPAEVVEPPTDEYELEEVPQEAHG
jgi:CHAD domain-containing protein